MKTGLRFLVLAVLLGLAARAGALNLVAAGRLPAGTEIVELRTMSARHYSNGDGTIRAVLEAKYGPETDTVRSLNASFSGYSELAYVYGLLETALKHSGSYFYAGYYGVFWPDAYIVERGYVQWDIASIPDSSTVNGIRCSTYCSGYTANLIDSFKLFQMSLQPSIVTDAVALYNDAGDGMVYGYYPGLMTMSGWLAAVLNANAVGKLQSYLSVRLDTNWFAIGYSGYPTIFNANTWERQFDGWNMGYPPRLVVDYAPPGANDVGVTRVLAPTGVLDSGAVTAPACSVQNYGATAQTYKVRLRVGAGGALATDSATVVNHAPGTRVRVLFPNRTAGWPRNWQSVTCSTELAGDGNPANNRRRDSVFIRVTDVGVTRIETPAGTIDSGTTIAPACWVGNMGNVTPGGSFYVAARCGTFYTDSVLLSPRPPGDSVRITFRAFSAWPRGTQTLACSTRLATDLNRPNDRKTASFTVRVLDAEAVAIAAPTGTVDSGTSLTPQATVRNNGTVSVTFSVRLDIGPWTDAQTVTGLAAGASRSVSFSSWTATQRGPNTVRCSVALSGDAVPANNRRLDSVRVRVTDVAVQRIEAPAGVIDSGTSVTPACWAGNWGNATPGVSFYVAARCGGFYADSALVAPCAPGDSVRVTFQAFSAWPRGTHTFACSTRLATDLNPVNDRKTGLFTVRVLDAGPTAILAPSGSVDSGTIVTPQVRVRNFGNTGISLGVRLRIDGGYAALASGSMGADRESVFTFPAWTAVGRGSRSVSCSTELTGDAKPGNDRIAGTVAVEVRDVGVTEITVPADTIVPSLILPEAVLRNHGTRRDPVMAQFLISSVPPYEATRYLAAGLPPGVDTSITFTTWSATVGSYVARCSLYETGGQNPANDTLGRRFTVTPALITDVGVTAITAPTGIRDTAETIVPAAAFENFGSAAASFRTWFRILDSLGSQAYLDSLNVTSLLPGQTAALNYAAWLPVHQEGRYTSVCSLSAAGDTAPGNDRLSGSFVVRGGRQIPGTPGWYRMANVPSGARGRRVKDGAGLAYAVSRDTEFVYALKGNNTTEFYRYDVSANAWRTVDSVPSVGRMGRKKNVKKGGSICHAGDAAGRPVFYATKGNNTLEFWRYHAGSAWSPAGSRPAPDQDLFYPWSQMADVPTGARALKDAVSLVAVDIGGTTFIYLLKGSATTEFCRYNTASGTWQVLGPAPSGASGKPYKAGSRLALDPLRDRLYLLKGTYNEFYAYDVASEVWTTLEKLPLTGSAGRKKAKDGASLACQDGVVYCLKGGNTQEYWRYESDSGRWREAEQIPLGDGKRVKGGGSLTSDGQVLWALKGNNTLEYWQYVPAPRSEWSSAQALAGQAAQGSTKPQAASLKLQAEPNPFRGTATISYALPWAGPVSLRLYDISGKLVQTLAEGHQAQGSYSISVHQCSPVVPFASGVYILKLEARDPQLGTQVLTRKVVVE